MPASTTMADAPATLASFQFFTFSFHVHLACAHGLCLLVHLACAKATRPPLPGLSCSSKLSKLRFAYLVHAEPTYSLQHYHHVPQPMALPGDCHAKLSCSPEWLQACSLRHCQVVVLESPDSCSLGLIVKFVQQQNIWPDDLQDVAHCTASKSQSDITKYLKPNMHIIS
jgi:hypothetical protein